MKDSNLKLICGSCYSQNALINKVCRVCHDPLPAHCTQCGRLTSVLSIYRGITMCDTCVKEQKKNG